MPHTHTHTHTHTNDYRLTIANASLSHTHTHTHICVHACMYMYTDGSSGSVPLLSQKQAAASLVLSRTPLAEQGEPWIDPKYLPPDAASQPFSTGTPNTAHSSTQGKVAKNSGSSPSSQGQAPLFSAYFPKS